MTMPQQPYDVAIVGFGPVGAVAASLLGRAGLRVFVCDRQTEVYDRPRAIAMDHEILRVCQNLGVLAEIEPHTAPLQDTEYFGVDGQLIKRMTSVGEPYPLAHTPAVSFTQPPVERALRAQAAATAGVTVELGLTLEQLTQRDDGVALDLIDAAGTTRTVDAGYVIGCDGASSTVRALVGIELIDLKFDEAWLVVDLLANARGVAKLPAFIQQWCDPVRPSSYVIGPGMHRRWEISLNAGEDPVEATTPARTWELLAPWLTPDDGTLWRQASYRFHALVAEEWRRGRVFIAGDAAHQQPPFLGQGMCQGVRDVVNLAWKLDAVLHGRASDALLDTYGSERKRHVEQLTERIKMIGAVLCERDPVKARERDAALIAADDGVVKATPRQDVQPRLADGLLDDSSAAAGELFPQPWALVDGRRVRLDDLVGAGWRLVLQGDSAPLRVEPVLQTALALATVRIGDAPGGLPEADGVAADWFARHGCIAALVRPDHYVYGTASTPDDLARLQRRLSSVFGPSAVEEAGAASAATARQEQPA